MASWELACKRAGIDRWDNQRIKWGIFQLTMFHSQRVETMEGSNLMIISRG